MVYGDLVHGVPHTAPLARFRDSLMSAVELPKFATQVWCELIIELRLRCLFVFVDAAALLGQEPCGAFCLDIERGASCYIDILLEFTVDDVFGWLRVGRRS